MVRAKPQQRQRRGATAVETAIVLLPLTIMLFGIYEYGRLLMDWNLLNNSAREGCRYALANNTKTTISSDVQNIVTTYMAGRDAAAFTSFTVTVSGTHSGVATTVNNLVPGDQITVTVSGNYKFLRIVPFNVLPNALTLTSASTMICEGAT
jgi:Flp pilus assembly protein TadG